MNAPSANQGPALNSVAVIGGGITGLTAAWRLQNSGIPVTLYEAGEHTGGVIRTVRSEGYLAECGPNTLLQTSPRIGDVIRDIGLTARRQDSNPSAENRYVVRGRKPVNLPTTAFRFIASGLFSVSAKFRLLAEPFIAKGQMEDECVASFVRRRLGPEFLDYAIDPLVSGIYAGDPAKLSLKQAFPKIYALESQYGSLIRGQILGARERKRRAEVAKDRAPKLSFDEGLQVLPDALAGKLGGAIRLNCNVKAILRNATGWTVVYQRAGGPEERADYQTVVFAGTAYQLAQLRVENVPPLDFSRFKDVYYPPVASVVLGFRRSDVDHPINGFGMLVPSIEKFNILGTIFNSSLFPRRAPEGHVLISTYLGGAKRPELAAKPVNELVDLTVKDLDTLLGIHGKPTFVHHTAYERAIPQYNVGYGALRDWMDAAEKSAPGLMLAGHYRHGVSLSDSILSGLSTAEKIIETSHVK